MAKKLVYLDNALKGLVEELTEKVSNKKKGDRISFSAYYGNKSTLFRQSEIDASICKVFKDTGIGLEQLPCKFTGAKIVLQIVDSEAFEKLYTIKERKPTAAKTEAEQSETPKAETPKAETPKAETPKAETVKENKAEAIQAVQETQAEYIVSAFEQVKALIPSLSVEEKKELIKLLKA